MAHEGQNILPSKPQSKYGLVRLEEKQGRALKLARFLSTDLAVADMLLRSNGNCQERREKVAHQRIESFDKIWAKNR